MRKGRNTDALVRRTLQEILVLDPTAIAEVVYTADLSLAPCRVVCSGVCTSPPFRCAIQDGATDVLDRMAAADVVVLGAPQYFRAPPAGFHTLIERLVSCAFFQATRAAGEPSALAGKPCGLIAVAEYSNPQSLLEYLHDACLLLKMRPVRLESFPHLGVAGHGAIETDSVFKPLDGARELGQKLALWLGRP
jgi:multimeric flavodoxin WrbA